MNQNRDPRGTPTGGQFAAKTSPESDVKLEAIVQPTRVAVCDLSPGDIVDLEGDSCADSEGDNQSFEFEYETVEGVTRETPGCTVVHFGFDSVGFPPEHVLSVVGHNHDFDEDAELQDALTTHGYQLSDLVSSDRDLRMAAHSAAGDLVFEGALLSNALQLSRHDPNVDEGRMFHWPKEVYVRGNRVSWNSLPATDQLEYIRGYAAAVAHDGDREHRPPMHDDLAGDGYVRGTNAVHAAKMIDDGSIGDRGLTIVDPDAIARRLVVVNITPVQGGYRAEVAGGQYRHHYAADGSGGTVPWTEGSRVFFQKDALGV